MKNSIFLNGILLLVTSFQGSIIAGRVDLDAGNNKISCESLGFTDSLRAGEGWHTNGPGVDWPPLIREAKSEEEKTIIKQALRKQIEKMGTERKERKKEFSN